jgi:hypothetical protein
MSRSMSRFNQLSWWYWLATDLLLGAALWGGGPGFAPVVGLTLLQTLHYRVREGSWSAFPVQVRVGYLLWLLAGLWPPLSWFHWIQLAGTTAMVLADYCPLARMVSLLPWNRRAPLSPRLVWRTFTSPPIHSIRDLDLA